MRYLFLIAIFSYSYWLLGQNKSTQTYSGNFEGGKATYSYYENNEYERIYNGDFEYTGNVEDYVGLVFNISGDFANNLKEGKWIFSVEDVKSPVLRTLNQKDKALFQLLLATSSGDLTKEQIQVLKKAVNTGTTEVCQTYSSTLTGQYVAGKLEGMWTFKETSSGEQLYELGNHDSPINSAVSFKDNHLVGSFLYKMDEKNYVNGQFNQNGAIDGKWITKWVNNGIEFENICEYENGHIIKMIERNTATGEILLSDNQIDSKGLDKIAKAIFFWVDNSIKFDQLNVSKRNYMFKFPKGIVTPKSDYNF